MEEEDGTQPGVQQHSDQYNNRGTCSTREASEREPFVTSMLRSNVGCTG